MWYPWLAWSYLGQVQATTAVVSLWAKGSCPALVLLLPFSVSGSYNLCAPPSSMLSELWGQGWVTQMYHLWLSIPLALILHTYSTVSFCISHPSTVPRNFSDEVFANLWVWKSEFRRQFGTMSFGMIAVLGSPLRTVSSPVMGSWPSRHVFPPVEWP